MVAQEIKKTMKENKQSFETGDLVRLPNNLNPDKPIFGIVYYCDNTLLLQMPDGSLLTDAPENELEFVSKTALKECAIFTNTIKVEKDFSEGKFDELLKDFK